MALRADHGDGRAVGAQRRRVVLGLDLEGLAIFRVGGLEGGRVRQGYIPFAVHHDSFQLFGAHDRTHAGTARGAVAVVHDGRKQHLLLASRADDGGLGLFMGLGAQGVIGRVRRLAPQVLGGPQLGAVAFDPEVNGLGGGALEDDGVVSGPLQLGREIAAGI